MIITDDVHGFKLDPSVLKEFQGAYEYYFTDIITHEKTIDQNYFDTLYAKNADPWNFTASDYEQKKYKTLINSLGNLKNKNVLELGCSIGIQTLMLAKLCNLVTAVDISEAALIEAKSTCATVGNIKFELLDISKCFPKGKFDTIICSEIAYYLSNDDLNKLFVNVNHHLLNGGKFAMVHWTGFVPDYPLNGNYVHNKFEDYIKIHSNFKEVESHTESLYRLQVWQKIN